MFVNIDFDNKSAVASISLEGWAQPLVDFLARYFTIHKDMLHLDYSHLSTENSGVRVTDWLYGWHTEREHFIYEFENAAQHGQIALTLKILGHGPTGIERSRSILDQTSYRCAQETFGDCILNGDPSALRETIVAKIEPRAIWVEWLLENRSCSRNKYLADHQIMKALMVNTSEEDCIYVLQLVAPTHGGNNWAFDQLIQLHWQCVCDYLEKNIDRSSDYSSNRRPEFVLTLFENSSKVQTSRWVCEQVFERAAPAVFTELIEHCCAILPEDVRNLFLRWNIHSKKEKYDYIKGCVDKAFSRLATLYVDTIPSDLALAAAWHKFGDPARSSQQSVAASLKELPSRSWDRESLWTQLGPAAREAWRQDLFEQVNEDPELAQGLLNFACLWLEQTAFAEVEPVLLRLMDDEEHLAFANRLVSTDVRQLQLRCKGLLRCKQGALDLEGPVGRGEGATELPSVGAQTWLSDPSVEQVIYRALSKIEEEFCREYSETWGEDEEAHTARLLTLTMEAIGNVSDQLRQLSNTTRGRYPSLTVKVRQPSKREEGANTPAGAPLGADVLFLSRIVEKGETVIQRATLMQVKKRRGTDSGRGFSSRVGINLKQCEDILKQSEHAYYLFATPASPRPVLWVAPARLVRNLTQLHTSKTSVSALQVRDASCSYADFFLHELVGLWAGDEHEDIIAVANGDPRLGRTPRHIVDIEVRRQSD
ncbi:TPA: hypothetical protein MFH03_005164 [Klebsiella pneumoniae]|uniref:hypothetical protein n=1 Tax=Klebsiella pneumoniae complex TaxID=3390273 RepID=UPI000765D368|nr:MULTISPECIES: hypothetical protein [Klebsiella]MCE0161611.1 hypothetical protein [Klebsiella variicola subsp. variicola]NWO50113.1 hypothetical protein [Klebsiella pneumoniae]HBQ6836646.1 hypothetical protein [Klebsiella quasipneumoniae subsp. similipneumoniae]HBW7834642.1 hypothetical protein [Klebsiella pneumoniae]